MNLRGVIALNAKRDEREKLEAEGVDDMTMRWTFKDVGVVVDIVKRQEEFDIDKPFRSGELIAVRVKSRDGKSLVLKGRLFPDKDADGLLTDPPRRPEVETDAAMRRENAELVQTVARLENELIDAIQARADARRLAADLRAELDGLSAGSPRTRPDVAAVKGGGPDVAAVKGDGVEVRELCKMQQAANEQFDLTRKIAAMCERHEDVAMWQTATSVLREEPEADQAIILEPDSE